VHLSYRRDSGSAWRGASGLEGGDAEDGDDLSGAIIGTDEHPFWSLTRNGWIAMGDLKPGERLLLADGEATVTAARIEQLAEPVTVYNFEVADWHTYHVGSQEAGWVFVHNLCDPGKLTRRLQRLGYDNANAARIVNAATRGEQVVIVGENMRRVRAVARMVQRAGGRPVTYNPRNVIIGPATKPALHANRNWIRYWAQKKRAPVIDIGRQRTSRGKHGPSKFYGLENRMLGKWGIYTPFGG